jgi:hypothetical protein
MADQKFEDSSNAVSECFSTFYGWFRLLINLKLDVLSHILSSCEPWAIDNIGRTTAFERHLGPFLTRGNRELFGLAEQVYYANSTFMLHIEESYSQYLTQEYYNNSATTKFPQSALLE